MEQVEWIILRIELLASESSESSNIFGVNRASEASTCRWTGAASTCYDYTNTDRLQRLPHHRLRDPLTLFQKYRGSSCFILGASKNKNERLTEGQATALQSGFSLRSPWIHVRSRFTLAQKDAARWLWAGHLSSETSSFPA